MGCQCKHSKKIIMMSLSSVLIALICAFFTLRRPERWGQWALWAVCAAASVYFSGCFWQSKDTRQKVCFGITGAVLSFCWVLAARLDYASRSGWDGLAAALIAAAVMGPAIGGILIALSGFRFKRSTDVMRIGPKGSFFLCWVLLLLAWLPVIIAFFPGITGYDMDAQIWQLEGHFNTHHPLLHTLILGACMKIGEWLLGSTTWGYGIHTLLQTLALSAAIAYGLSYLVRKKASMLIWCVILAYFMFAPQHSIMAVSGTKDVIFSAGMLTITIEIWRWFDEEERQKSKKVLIKDILLITATGMLRNNAVYGLVLIAVIGLIFFRRKLGIKFIALLLCGCIAATGTNAVLKKVTNAGSGSIREMFSIPCQQLARIYSLYGYDAPVSYEIDELLPFAYRYREERSDFSKNGAKVTTPERMVRFLKVWVREAFHYPIEYIDAFLYNTKGFWDISDLSFAYTYSSEPQRRAGVLVLWHCNGLGVDLINGFQGLRDWCFKMFSDNEYTKCPFLKLILNPALYTYLLLFAVAWALWKRSKGIFAGLMPPAVNLLTLFLGPCAIVRYQYVLMLIAPLALLLMSCKSRKDPEMTQTRE